MRKVWRQLRREGFDVARCRVARLMKGMDIQGIIRGKPHKTTIPDKKQPCPLDKVNRQFRAPAPNRLWVSDFTYVATWKGFVYVAFVIDAYARRIVGWRVGLSAHAGFVLDSLEQAVHQRRPAKGMGLVHHSDRGSQGGLNRSSQHPGDGGCDGWEKTLGCGWTEEAVVAGAAAGCDPRGSGRVLGGDCGGAIEQGRGGGGGCIDAGGIEVVPEVRRHATSPFGCLGSAVVGTLSVVCRT